MVGAAGVLPSLLPAVAALYGPQMSAAESVLQVPLLCALLSLAAEGPWLTSAVVAQARLIAMSPVRGMVDVWLDHEMALIC